MTNQDYFIGLLAIVACVISLLIGNLAGAYVLLVFVCILWCVSWAITMRKPTSIVYVCDEKACTSCSKGFGRWCYHTTDISHAANFEDLGDGMYMEKHDQ